MNTRKQEESTANETNPALSADTSVQDAWLEALLQQDAVGSPASRYVDDNGFSARVMSALPERRAARNYYWILPLAASLGALIGGIWLSGFDIYVHDLLRPFEWDLLSLNRMLILLTPVALLYWFAAYTVMQPE